MNLSGLGLMSFPLWHLLRNITFIRSSVYVMARQEQCQKFFETRERDIRSVMALDLCHDVPI